MTTTLSAWASVGQLAEWGQRAAPLWWPLWCPHHRQYYHHPRLCRRRWPGHNPSTACSPLSRGRVETEFRDFILILKVEVVWGNVQCVASFEYFPRYVKIFVSFEYGGCSGNGNNFFSSSECERVCVLGYAHPRTRVPTDTCLMPVDRGTCQGHLPRWFWDTKTKKCQTFDWTGITY